MEEDLRLLANPADLAKLVLLDQWTRNCDRYRPQPRRVNLRNVFFSRQDAPAGLFRLVAMDHTHCFTCGGPLTRAIAQIDHVQDPLLFGLFPQFVPVIQRSEVIAAIRALSVVPNATVQEIVAGIPADWQVDAPTRGALSEYLIRRRDWLADTFLHRLFPQDELFP